MICMLAGIVSFAYGCQPGNSKLYHYRVHLLECNFFLMQKIHFCLNSSGLQMEELVKMGSMRWDDDSRMHSWKEDARQDRTMGKRAMQPQTRGQSN